MHASVGQLDVQKTLLERFGGHGPHLSHAAGIDALLPINEIKQAVFLDRTADRGAKLIADQLLHRHAGLVVEPGIGGCRGIAIVLVKRTVELIGAALGDQHHLAAGRTALIDTLAAHRYTEFLNRIEWNRQHGVEARIDIRVVPIHSLVSGASRRVLSHKASVLVVVHIHAIQGDVVLIAARAQHFAVRRYARLQAQQLDHVPGLERKLADLLLRKCIAHRKRQRC